MSFDGIVTRAIVHELQKLVGNRISRISQPHTSDIVLTIRANGEMQKLLFSANPTYPRIHITTEEFVNPQEAPMFCMLLRKHCENGLIESITQVEMERIIHIDIKSRDELGDVTSKRIIVEIMGRHSNIILVDKESNMILDGIQHVSHSISQYRQVLPGRLYLDPPDQGKRNPLHTSQQEFIQSLDWNAGKIETQIVQAFSGISPLLAKEFLFRAKLSTREAMWGAFEAFFDKVRAHQYTPTIVHTKEKSFFSITELTHITSGETIQTETVAACLQTFFQGKAMRDVVKQKVHDLIQIITNVKNKNEKKINKLKQTIVEANEAERFRIYGEIITANMYQLKKGDKELTTENWYDENDGMITIPLDPLKTPSENLQTYYKKYNKAKNSVQFVEEQIKLAKEEFEYLDGLLVQLEHATLLDIVEIREEMVEQGYLRDRQKRGSKKKKLVPTLETYYSSEGIPILVGKNNKQNEYLTNKVATSSDTWLHTKDIPGSHVVIRAKQYSEETLHEAAMIAAFFSKAQQGSQVPVDYTLIKHVKKPSGAKPGFVIYEQQKTLFVTPKGALIHKLRRNNPL